MEPGSIQLSDTHRTACWLYQEEAGVKKS